ncbi:WXG100 family type VII secretion target [Nocardia lasii]|uniref:WXG100 family type VII secretion target n=1 Tax=Nocardia lasii TaxID=1616107 RepID=A0ABW1JT32_9NOCA
MADGPNAAGRFLNENTLAFPGNADTFDDGPAPDNDLLTVEDGSVDFRDTYYQEGNPFLSSVGLPEVKDKDGKQEVDSGIFKGTIHGDTLENGYGLYQALTTDASVLDRTEAIAKAAITGRDWYDAATTIGKAVKGGSALAKFDPFNFLGSQLMSWMLEHVEPMRKSLDSISGNPDMVQAYSDAWGNIAQHLRTTATEWAAALDTGIGGWVGCAADAYRTRATELTGQIAEKAAIAEVLSKCNEGMTRVVETVRAIIIEILSSLAGMLAEATAILIVSGGTATPGLIARALLDISLAMTSVGSLLVELGKSLMTLKTMAMDAVQLIRGVTEVETAK